MGISAASLEITSDERSFPAKEASAYRPQLDALRGLAIAAVLIHHLYPELFRAASWLPTGWEGVRLFFTISGYLITGILLKYKARCLKSAGSRAYLLRQFYARRFLRIFPVYYLTLIVAGLLNFGSVRREWLWHTCYLSNVLFAIRGDVGCNVAHFWSLAVEEQYYVVWPLLLLLTSEKRMPLLFAAFIVCGPLSRALLLGLGCNEFAVQFATTSNFDSLGMGGLLAFLNQPCQRWESASFRFRMISLAAGAPVYLANKWFGCPMPVVLDLAFAGISVCAVHQAAAGFKGPMRILMGFPPLLYLGKISYGVYLFHNFSEPGVALVLRRLYLRFPESSGLRFLLLTGATIAAASVSWYCFEKPLNRLKKWFPYECSQE